MSLLAIAIAAQISTAAALDDPVAAKAGIAAHIVQAADGVDQSRFVDQLLRTDGYEGPRGRWLYLRMPSTTGPVPAASIYLSGMKGDSVSIIYRFRERPAANEPVKVCRVMSVRYLAREDREGMRRASTWCHRQLGTSRQVPPLTLPPVEARSR